MPKYPTTKENKIKFPEAPSGFINITKWIPPFVPVKNGHGFYGVVAEDSIDGTLQCHVCGEWKQQLASHYSSKHKMTGEDYRKKFGLLDSTALKSKRIRLLQSAVISKLQKEGKMNVGNKRNANGKSYGFKKNNKHASNRKGKPKALEAQNKFGVCDLQITDKIIELSRKLGKTPTLIDIREHYGIGLVTIMHSRYGSYVKYCKEHLKMKPNYSSYNPRPKKEYVAMLLDKGRKALKEGKPLLIKKLLSNSDSRTMYKYFKNFKDYKKQLLNK